MSYEPTYESLSQHAVPAWFDDAKFGIFIHWGPYSVPAWAERRNVQFERADWFAHNSYAEWYQNTLSIAGSPTAERHARMYGDAPYDRFCDDLRANLKEWDAAAWADLFAACGARYVVPTTKHHDGFLMWPGHTPNPHKQRWQMDRDLIGDLGAAVRARGLRFGLYYSGGLDWTFGGMPITSTETMLAAIHQTPEYAAYVDAHWRELIDRYKPDVLWNDIGYPAAANYNRLFADYYNAQPDGLVNNRFAGAAARDGGAHYDFYTPEYATRDKITRRKWEACRGIGNSFGYNQDETEDDYAAARDLIQMLCDIVSKNGNLLLNVGPDGHGRIPDVQASRLREIGAWLRDNGDAIYGTRPWHTAAATTREGHNVRFTSKGDAVYAIVFDPPDATLTLPLVPAGDVTLVRDGAPVAATPDGDALRIMLPRAADDAAAIALRITPR